MKCYRKNERHLIENYEKALADNFKGWVLHHRLELTLEGEFAHTAEELEKMGMYYNRPYFELIYLKSGEHASLHGKVNDLSYLHTEETNRKRALTQTGRPSWNKGKIRLRGSSRWVLRVYGDNHISLRSAPSNKAPLTAGRHGMSYPLSIFP